MREFLGPTGSATIVLLNSPDQGALPKMGDVRRLFAINDLKYYKGNGWYWEDISKLERALSINSGSSLTPPWQQVSTTNYLLLPPGTNQDIFFTIKYASLLVEGFDLTNEACVELHKLLDIHDEINNWRNAINHFYEKLERNSESAQRKCIKDPSILDPDLPGIKQLLAGYGDSAINDIVAEIKQWCTTFKWKA